MQGAALIGNSHAMMVLMFIHATAVIAVLMHSSAVNVRDSTIGVTMSVGDSRHDAGELGYEKEPNEPGNKLVPAPKQHNNNLSPSQKCQFGGIFSRRQCDRDPASTNLVDLHALCFRTFDQVLDGIDRRRRLHDQSDGRGAGENHRPKPALHAETNSIMERRETRLRQAGRVDPLAHIASRPAVVAIEAVSPDAGV
jgi:hypothetical protein